MVLQKFVLAVGILLVGQQNWLNTESARPALVEFSLVGYTSAPRVVVLGSMGVGTRIDAIWISLKDLKFHVKSKAATSTYAHGPITAELVDGFATGLPESASLDAGQYSGFEFSLRRSKGQARGTPFDLRGASIILQGHRADGVRFLVRTRLDNVFNLHSKTQGFAVTEGHQRLFLAVDAARWMAGVDLSVAEIHHDGAIEVIRVDDMANTRLLRIFQRNLLRGFALFRDTDGDGAFGPRDRIDKLASGGP
jgi:hypothetical protein